MAGAQLLRQLVNERLAAAADEIFGLVEKTLAEYQDEAARSRREVLQLKTQLEQLAVLTPEVMLRRAGVCDARRCAGLRYVSRVASRRNGLEH